MPFPPKVGRRLRAAPPQLGFREEAAAGQGKEAPRAPKWGRGLGPALGLASASSAAAPPPATT